MIAITLTEREKALVVRALMYYSHTVHSPVEKSTTEKITKRIEKAK